MSPGTDFLVKRRFMFATSSTWCSDGSLGAPSKPTDVKNDLPELQKYCILVYAHAHTPTQPQDFVSISAAGTRRRRLRSGRGFPEETLQAVRVAPRMVFEE